MSLPKDEKEGTEADSNTSEITALKSRFRSGSLKAWDAHAHSFYSSDVKERPKFHPLALFFKAVERGMDFVSLTDHDEYRQNEIVLNGLRGRPELTARYVPGTEFTIDDESFVGHVIHVNVYMHTRKDFDRLMKLRGNLIKFAEYCELHELPFQYNHPVWFALGKEKSIGEKNLRAILRCGKLFPVIESCNSNRPVNENTAAAIVARLLGKGVTAGSDSHFGNVGARACTLAEGETFREFWENVKNGKSLLVRRHITGKILKGKVLETIYYLAFPSGIKQIGKRYGCDTGNMTINKLMGFGNRFPLVVRLLLPYLRRKVQKTKLIDRYVARQDEIGKMAAEFFISRYALAEAVVPVRGNDMFRNKL